MTPVERGACALALEQSGVDEWDALDEAFQERLKEQVRVVVRAFREPSDKVLEDGAGCLWAGSRQKAEAKATEVWQTMIDAILTTKG